MLKTESGALKDKIFKYKQEALDAKQKTGAKP